MGNETGEVNREQVREDYVCQATGFSFNILVMKTYWRIKCSTMDSVSLSHAEFLCMGDT